MNKDVLVDTLTKLEIHQPPHQCTLEVHIENLDDCHLIVNVEERRVILPHGQIEVAEHDLVGD